MATKITQISSLTYDSTAYLGMLTVTYDEGIDNIIRNKGDANLGATAGKATSASVTGTITGFDRTVFEGMPKGDTKALVFVGVAVDGGGNVTTTIADTMLLKLNGSLEHDGDGGGSLSFEAFYADGQTSPVSSVTA